MPCHADNESVIALVDRQVSWGVDLASEHERYLTEEVFQQPVIVYNYPKEIKVPLTVVIALISTSNQYPYHQAWTPHESKLISFLWLKLTLRRALCCTP